MRLDVYLVESGRFRSRARAKAAILEGKVKVGGVVVRKPSRDIGAADHVLTDDVPDMPKGYFKLKRIQEVHPIIGPNDSVLDLGSSAGGFVLYASGIAAKVRGIEFSRDFQEELLGIEADRSNVSIAFADVFHTPLEDLSEGLVDVLLIDMTLEPEDSILALIRVSPLLKPGGKLLLVLKMEHRHDGDLFVERVAACGFMIIELIKPVEMEIYVIAEKCS